MKVKDVLGTMILMVLFFIAGYRINRMEKKIKEMDRTIQFQMITSKEMDWKGLELWEKLRSEGKVDRFFTWETSEEMVARLKKEGFSAR